MQFVQNTKVMVNQFTKKQRYIVCSVCKVNIDLKSPSFRDYFAVMDVRMEIKNMIENNSEYYKSITSTRGRDTDGYFKDTYDGIRYKNFIRSLRDTKKRKFNYSHI